MKRVIIKKSNPSGILSHCVAFIMPLFFFNAAISQTRYVKGDPALAYWSIGNAGERIIILHGGPAAGHRYLRPEWDALTSAGMVIYYDQRGSGKSGKAECYSWQAHVNDLKRLTTQVAANEKVILAASSWGSQLALLYAYTYPEDLKAIILSGNVKWFGESAPPKDCAEYLPRPENYPGLDTSFVFVSLNDRSKINPLRADSSSLARLEHGKYFEAPFSSRLATKSSLMNAPTLAALKSIRLPVLLIEGVGDCKDVYLKDESRTYAAVLTGSEINTIPGACHDPWYTHRAAFFEECSRFIKTLPPVKQ